MHACMCSCTCTHMHISTYVYIYIYVCIQICVYSKLSLCIYTCICTCVCVYACRRTCLLTYIQTDGQTDRQTDRLHACRCVCACVCVYVYMHVYECTYLIMFASFDWNGGGGGGYVGRIYTAIYLGSPNPSCKTLIPLAPCSAGFGRSCRGAKCLRALGRGLELRRPLTEKRIGLNEQKRCGGGAVYSFKILL